MLEADLTGRRCAAGLVPGAQDSTVVSRLLKSSIPGWAPERVRGGSGASVVFDTGSKDLDASMALIPVRKSSLPKAAT